MNNENFFWIINASVYALIFQMMITYQQGTTIQHTHFVTLESLKEFV